MGSHSLMFSIFYKLTVMQGDGLYVDIVETASQNIEGKHIGDISALHPRHARDIGSLVYINHREFANNILRSSIAHREVDI